MNRPLDTFDRDWARAVVELWELEDCDWLQILLKCRRSSCLDSVRRSLTLRGETGPDQVPLNWRQQIRGILL